MMRVFFLVGLAVLSVPQEPADPVARQVARLESGDSRTAFDAVERLLQLPEADRARIEAALEKVGKTGGFYATVVREELKTRALLGAKAGTVAPVTIVSERKPALDLVPVLSAKGGLDLAVVSDTDEKVPGEPVDLRMEGVAPMAALRELCVAAGGR